MFLVKNKKLYKFDIFHHGMKPTHVVFKFTDEELSQYVNYLDRSPLVRGFFYKEVDKATFKKNVKRKA